MNIAEVAVSGALYEFDKLYSYRIPSGLSVGVGQRVIVPFGKGAPRMGMVLGLKSADAEGELKYIVSAEDSSPVLPLELVNIVLWLKENTFCTYFDAVKTILPPGMSRICDAVYTLSKDFAVDTLTADEQRAYSVLKRKRTEITRKRLEKTDAEILPLLPSLIEKGAVCESSGSVQKMSEKTVSIIGLTQNYIQIPLTPRQAEVVELLEQNGGAVCESSGSVQKMSEKTVSIIGLTQNYIQIPLTPRQAEVVELLEQNGDTSVRELIYYSGASRELISRLVSMGVCELSQDREYRKPKITELAAEQSAEIQLSAIQLQVYRELYKLYGLGIGSTALLYGVTGSGKTQVFLKLCKDCIEDGRQAIILVPEISLTPQTIATFNAIFGERVAVLHSSLSMGQRLDEWQRISSGKVDVVVGTRSAVFAPLKKLGLIVVDEEHENTYKSEHTPRYDAREVARQRARIVGGLCLLASATPSVESFYRARQGKFSLFWLRAPRYDAREVARQRARIVGGLCLLASATPSVESFYRARQGKFSLFWLRERHGGAKLPYVGIIDLKAEDMRGRNISDTLANEIQRNLNNAEQSILLVNRRGHSTLVRCADCHQYIMCKNCSVSMKYHRANSSLVCHYCGLVEKYTGICPYCSSENIALAGAGTQRLEHELELRFPDARILRMDTDTTVRRSVYEQALTDFRDGRYDILVGTQMVAKGLNLPLVTLVGVVGVDNLLYSGGFKNYERVFSLITQVVGRAGRYTKYGRAYIETYSPEHPVILSAAAQDYDEFYEDEIRMRRLSLYPPFCVLIAFVISSDDEAMARNVSQKVSQLCAGIANTEFAGMPIRLFGAVPAQLYKVSGRYRYNVVAKLRRDRRTVDYIARVLSAAKAGNRGVTIHIEPSFEG